MAENSRSNAGPGFSLERSRVSPNFRLLQQRPGCNTLPISLTAPGHRNFTGRWDWVEETVGLQKEEKISPVALQRFRAI